MQYIVTRWSDVLARKNGTPLSLGGAMPNAPAKGSPCAATRLILYLCCARHAIAAGSMQGVARDSAIEMST